MDAPYTIELDEDTHQYTVNGQPFPSVTQILDMRGAVKGKEYFTPQTSERGKTVHKITELYDRGELDELSVDPALAGYVEAWKMFVLDMGLGVEYVELKLADIDEKYAGTIDRIGSLRDGTRAIIDIRTGIAGAAAKMQLAAYGYLNHKNTHIKRANAFGIVRLDVDGKYHYEKLEGRELWRARSAWRAALALTNYLEG